MGDSTARQQAVSLCCLMTAGARAAGGTYRVVVTKALPFMDFKCRVSARVEGRGEKALVLIAFQRFMRADSLPTWCQALIEPTIPGLHVSSRSLGPA